MRIRTFLLALALVASITVAPAISRAATNDQLLAQIAQLLAFVQQLQSQLNAVEGGGVQGPVVGVVPGGTSAGSGACVSLTLDLRQGSENDEVRRLQEFLARDSSVYPEGITSGYYGRLTELAVQRWQAKNGVVSSGSPSTTGYGAVGPKTRLAMKRFCSGAEGNEAVSRDLVITPQVGPLPLQVTATFSLSGSSCSSFSLDWGDGTKPLTFDAGTTTNCTKDIAHKRATHTYNIPGRHRVTFRAGHGPLSLARVVSQTFVSVGETTPTGFTLQPTNGSAPLTTSVTFPVQGSTCTSYELDWGDGTVDRHEAARFDACSADTGTQSLTHTYVNPATYTVRLKTGNAPISQLQINEQWNVLVRGDIIPGAAVQVKPTAGVAPLIVNVDMLGFGEACTSYYLDWGDGSTVQEFDSGGLECDEEAFQNTFTHTYITPGNYIIFTKLGKEALGNLPVSTQTVVVGIPGSNTVRPNCPFPDTPVCGEIVGQCPQGFICGQNLQTFQNQCAMEDANARYVHQGQCNL